VSTTRITDLKYGTGKTKTRCLSSKLSDGDYILSPLLNCSQKKSSLRQISQMLHSRLGKTKKSKKDSGIISQKSSASRNTSKSKKNILSKMSISGTLTVNKLYQGVPAFTNQSQCNKLDSTHFRRVSSLASKESRSEQSVLPETSDCILPFRNTVSDKSSNEMNQSIDYFSEELEKEKIIPSKTENKRRSSDFFSSPLSGGNCARDVKSDNQSPSLFGDSLVIDTQLNDMLDECCIEPHTTADRNCQNPAQDCNQKSAGDLIIQQELPHMPGHQCLISVSSSGIDASKDEQFVSGKDPNKESSTVEACVFGPKILDSAKYDKENVIVDKLNLCETKEYSKMDNFSFQEHDHCHALSKPFVISHEVMKFKDNKSEALDKRVNSPAYHHAGMEGLELHASSDIVRDSMGREGIILPLSSCGSTNKQLSDPDSVYAEELHFYSVDDQTAMSPVNSNLKTKKGLVSPVTYNLNEKLLENLSKCDTTLNGSVSTKRKKSVSSDCSYSENEWINSKRRRVLHTYKITINEDEMNSVEMVSSFLKKNDNAGSWLDTENENTFESNKNLPQKRQCSDKKGCPNENHAVTEENQHTVEQGVKPNHEYENGITDSFLERAFDTYWDLDTGTSEDKKEDKVHHGLGLEKAGNSTSKTGPFQELHALIAPSVSNITQKCNGSDIMCVDIVSADSSSLNQSCKDTKLGGKIQQSCFVNSSLLEAAFNTSWDENPDHKEIKSLGSHGEKNGSRVAKRNMSLKTVDAHNDLPHQELCSENRSNKEHSSSKEGKKSACGRRRSPRLLAAAADKENRNSCGKASEVCKLFQIVKSVDKFVILILL
jgi:hypothetical protein